MQKSITRAIDKSKAHARIARPNMGPPLIMSGHCLVHVSLLQPSFRPLSHCGGRVACRSLKPAGELSLAAPIHNNRETWDCL